MSKTQMIYVVALAPLLLGADSSPRQLPTGTLRSALSLQMPLPRCGDDQYLVYRGGTPACETIAAGSPVQVASCANQLLTGKGGGTTACTDKGTATVTQTDVTRVENLLTRTTNIGTTITLLEQTANRAKAPVYVGVSAVQPSGQITHAGKDPGLNAANAHCDDAFAGSHMCSAFEMFQSVAGGSLTGATTVQKAWLYFPNWHNPVGTGTDPLAGLSDDCGQMTYPTGDRSWTGTVVEISANVLTPGGVTGLRFHGGGNAPCSNNTFPIACCK